MLIEEMVRPYICNGGWNRFFTSTPRGMILEEEEEEGGLIEFYTYLVLITF
jgi:hypothetical protein